MSFALTLCVVLIAVYGLASLLLAGMVGVVWRVGLERKLSRSDDVLAIRLLPGAGAAFLVLAVVLPAFLVYEPRHAQESVGPLAVALALIAVLALGTGIRRGWRASSAAIAFSRNCGSVSRWSVNETTTVDIVDSGAPIVVVIGGWRPRIVAARGVLDACSDEEFRRIVAHEAARISRHDNLRLLALIVCPDPRAWFPTGWALAARWRAAVELEADERATGADPRKRVALASAVVKVARLSYAATRSVPSLSMAVALDDVDGRVRRLLAPPPQFPRASWLRGIVICVAVVPLLAVPLYALVHQVLEALIAIGR